MRYTILVLSLFCTIAFADSHGKIYQQYCGLCHDPGLAGAPKKGDIADWAARLETQNLDQLLEHVKNGFNAMPPKGTCMVCTDDELKSAIEYMLPDEK